MTEQLTLDMKCVHHWHITGRDGVCQLCGEHRKFKEFYDIIDEREAAARKRGRAISPLGNSTKKKHYGSRIKLDRLSRVH